MKDVKVIFKGRNAPSGKTPGVTYMMGKARVDMLKKTGKYDMEIDMPKAKEIKKPSKKKANKEKE